MDKWLDRFLPDETDPKAMRRWRLCHSFVAWGGCGMAFIVVMAAVFGLPLVGQIAWAEQAATKSEVTNLKAEVAAIQRAVEEQKADTGEVIEGLLAAEMRVAAASRCKAPPGEREFQNKRIGELQTKYLKRTGSMYDVPSCSEL